MNKTQRLRKQSEALAQTFPRRNVPAARREPWERRCALLPCFCRGCGAGNHCGAVSCYGLSQGGWDHHRCWWHSRDNVQPCHNDAGTVPLHQPGAARVPSQCLLGHDAATIPVFMFPAMQREALSPAEPGVQPFPGAGASSADPVASRLPVFWQRKSPEIPPSLGNTFRASAGEQPRAGQTPSSSPVR